MSSRPYPTLLQLSLMMCMPAIALAQQDPAPLELPSLDVRSMVPESIQGTPGAANLLSRETVDTYKPYTLHDAFDFVPGVRTIDDDVLGLEQVEVLKGAGQIIHGPLNNHGIINFRNLRPTAEPQTRVELAAGNQSTRQSHISHRRTEGPLGMVFSYTGKEADGTFDVEEHEFTRQEAPGRRPRVQQHLGGLLQA